MDVAIVGSPVTALGQHRLAFGIVGGGPTHQEQLAVVVLLRQPVGLDHAERVLEAVEARDLGHEWPPGVEAEARHDRLDGARIELAVLVRQGIDGGRDEHLVDGQGARELRCREDGGVVALHRRPEKLPHRGHGGGEVDVAAPDPVRPRGAPRDQPRRLWIVNEDDVVGEREGAKILLGGLAVDGDVMLAQGDGLSVQGVVDRLGHRVELVASPDDVPARVDAQLEQQRHEPVQDLRDAATHGGRVDVLHAPAPEPLPEETELLDRRPPDEGRVGIEAGRHARGAVVPRRSSISPRRRCRRPSIV